MKTPKPAITIIVGFIAGLVISGVLGDIIVALNNAAGRITSAWSVSRAEKYVSGGDFYKAEKEYENALKKINPDNKKLIAKVKNNMALSVFAQAANDKNSDRIKESIAIFSQSLDLYKELNDSESIKQVETNIEQARKVLQSLEGDISENNIVER